MKHKFRAIFLLFLLLSHLALSVQASEPLPMIVDHADILSDTEEAGLEAQAGILREAYGMDIVILTVDSLEGVSAQTYADDYYDSHGYGYDADGSGLLFLLAMEEREWYISTCGNAIYALTDYGIQSLAEESFSWLEGDNYGLVFTRFLTVLPDYLRAWDSGAPIDGYADASGDYYHGTREEVVYYEQENSVNVLLCLAVGILAGGIAVFAMRASMNTKRAQHSAAEYLKTGAFHVTRHQDLFLYSNVSKVRRQQNNSTSRSGGGSSVHRSSGGRRHGGGGGRF